MIGAASAALACHLLVLHQGQIATVRPKAAFLEIGSRLEWWVNDHLFDR